jgi:RNA polymerase sigma-70 factor (ECF subfamily)
MSKEKNIQVLAESFISTRDERAFKFLYERVRPGVLNHCYTILKDFELAEDAFLNAMSKVWQKIDQYDNERGNFSTWCYNIARNESLLLLKSRSRYVTQTSEEIEISSAKEEEKNSTYEIEDDPLWDFLSGGTDIDEVYENVIEEIRDLPVIYRDIMIDREINGMKYKDIADKYGIKKRSIATRIRRARTKIRKKMEDASKKIKIKNE